MIRRLLRHPFPLIFAVALAAHGLLLLNDGLYYDSWMLDTHMQNGRYDLIYGWLNDHSRPFTGLYYLITGYLFVSPFWHKLSIFIYLLINTVIIYDLGRHLRLSHPESLLISLFSLIYPTYQAYVEHGANSQIANLNQFLVGAWFVLCTRGWSSFGHRIALALGWVFLFISFSTESLMTFYLGFILLLLVQQWQANGNSEKQTFIWGLKYRWAFILLPFIYVILIRVILFPPRALYVEYTAPKVENLLIPVYWVTYYRNVFIYTFTWSLTILSGIGSIVAIVLLYPWLSLAMMDNPISAKMNAVKRAITLMLFGLLLLALGSVPYIAGGRLLTAHGYDSRYALLVGVSMAIVLTGLLTFIGCYLTRYHEIITLITSLVIVAFIAANIDSYLGWQARWVRDRSWMLNLQSIKVAQTVSVFELDDQWLPLENERIGWYLPMDRRLDLNAMVQRTLKSDKYPIVDPVQAGYNDFYKEAFFVSRYDPAGCRAKLTIQRAAAAAQMGQFGIARRYWYYRFFVPTGMDAFLRGLTQVTVTPMNDPKATACKS